MIISSITPSQVWTSSSRSLTNIGSGALAATQTVNTVLAANSRVDLRTAAGQVAQISIAVQTGAAATSSIQIQLWDGTNALTEAVTAAAANAPIGFTGATNNSVGQTIQNLDATHTGLYQVSGLIWTP